MIWGIIGALDAEIALIKKEMCLEETKELYGSTFYVGKIYDQSVVLVCCSIGTINATVCASTIIREFGADVVVNVGIAGAMHKDLKILDVVISNDVMFHDADLGIIEKYYPFKASFMPAEELIALCQKACEAIEDKNFCYHVGRIASGDVFVNDTAMKEDIVARCNPYCVEMEGAAIGQVSYMNNKPFLIIRSMSDSANDEATETYDNWLELAANNSATIILKMLQQGL